MCHDVICGLKAGKYFIGDITHVLEDQPEYMSIWLRQKCEPGIYETTDGYFFGVAQTAQRAVQEDIVIFQDNDGFVYDVYNDNIGMVPYDMCSFSFKPSPPQLGVLACHGRIIESISPIIFCAKQGIFKIHVDLKTITIDTRQGSIDDKFETNTIDSEECQSCEDDYDYEDDDDYESWYD